MVKQAKKPLGHTAYTNWPKAEVNAGETKTVLVAPDGRLKQTPFGHPATSTKQSESND